MVFRGKPRQSDDDASAAAAAPAPAEIGDSDLLQRHLDGDPNAFRALIERYRQELYGFLARFTGDRELAEDVFQEAFLQLHISAATFDTSRRLKPWLFTIAANKARDALRKRTRHQMAPLDNSVGANGEDSATYGDLIPADIPLPEETLANLELRQAVEGIVQAMPENLRVVLIMAYFSDMSYKDIASALRTPLGTIKSRLHTAVKVFAEKWTTAARQLGYDQPS